MTDLEVSATVWVGSRLFSRGPLCPHAAAASTAFWTPVTRPTEPTEPPADRPGVSSPDTTHTAFHGLATSGDLCVLFPPATFSTPSVSLLSGSSWALISYQAIKPMHSFPWDLAQFFKTLFFVGFFVLILVYMVYVAYNLNSLIIVPFLSVGISYVHNPIPSGHRIHIILRHTCSAQQKIVFLHNMRLCRKVWENFPCKPPGPGVL